MAVYGPVEKVSNYDVLFFLRGLAKKQQTDYSSCIELAFPPASSVLRRPDLLVVLC